MATQKARGEGKAPKWPDVSCPEGSALTAQDILHAIVFLAARANTPELSRIIRLALRCATHGYETNLPPEEHCSRVLLAKLRADARDWGGAAVHLDH